MRTAPWISAIAALTLAIFAHWEPRPTWPVWLIWVASASVSFCIVAVVWRTQNWPLNFVNVMLALLTVNYVPQYFAHGRWREVMFWQGASVYFGVLSLLIFVFRRPVDALC